MDPFQLVLYMGHIILTNNHSRDAHDRIDRIHGGEPLGWRPVDLNQVRLAFYAFAVSKETSEGTL